MQIKGNGKWWFTTVMPGNEFKAGWGPDPQAHIHYDIRCSSCVGRKQFPTDLYGFWNKFYATQICSRVRCGGDKVTNKLHRAKEVAGPGGIRVFKYNIELPATSLALPA